MVRLRFMAVALLALAFAGSATQLGRTQQDSLAGRAGPLPAASEPAAVDSRMIYSLTDMGYDAELGRWIAETIPEMVEPNSWGGASRGAIRYYAPKNILIVKQTSAIQKKVEGFLKDLKTSMPKANTAKSSAKKTPHSGILPVDHREPAALSAANPASEPLSYPVPAAVKPPKHLFHFIIRYEGDGIIDDNVVKFMKSQLQGAKSPISVGSVAGAYVPCAPPAPPGLSPTAPSPGYSSSTPPAAYGSSVPPPEPAQAIGNPAATAAPAQPTGSPTPSVAPASPSPTPKKKKAKKDEEKGKPLGGETTR